MSEILLFQTDGRGVARLTLNRPERRNALDGELVGALLARIEAIENDSEVRVLVLTGSGEAFCSGADIDWMRTRLVDTPGGQPSACRDARRSDAPSERPFETHDRAHPGPGLWRWGRAHRCCDIAIASDTSIFALSEARLGLAPAVIAPYVIAAVGQRQARRLFLTAARVDAYEAQRLGLVHRVVPAEHLDEAVEAEVGCLLAGGPEALTHCKRISLGNLPQDPERTGSAELLMQLWASPEAREGLSAFLEKRKPRWDDKQRGDQ